MAWNALPALIRDGRERTVAAPRTACFRVGDAWLEVVSSHEPLLEEMEAVYGDCGAPAPPPGAPRFRCTAAPLPGAPLLSLAMEGAPRPDLLEAARRPDRFLKRRRYVDADGPAPGWRQLVSAASGEMLLAGDGETVVVAVGATPPEFVADCIVTAVQDAQADVLFLHAASVGIGGRGALIIAASGGGKSTAALMLAWRGHAFLGDDVAAVRRGTAELLPFPRSAGLRAGPLARLLADRLPASRDLLPREDGRSLVRVSRLFPAAAAGPVPLRAAFLLDGFGDRASITAYQPRLSDAGRLKAVATDSSSAWALSPGRDLMNLLVVLGLLSRARCHLVRQGPVEETALAIEAAMEEPCP